MSEFVNVTEVEILPLDKVDTLIAIDADKDIKRTSITVDQEIDADSTNPVSSKGVWEALEEFRGEVGVVIDDINTEIQDLDEDIADIRDEIIVLNDSLDDYATKELVDSEIKEAVSGIDLSNYYTKEQTYDTQTIDFKLSEVDQKFDEYYRRDQVYNKSEVDTKLSETDNQFADYYKKDQVYNKTEIDTKVSQIDSQFSDYYSKESTYNKTEVDTKLGDYATTSYVNGLIGDINSVLDEINGEEV